MQEKLCKSCGGIKPNKNKFYCSRHCSIVSRIGISYTKGVKQSSDTISKRVGNTDQLSKEEKRKQTMLLRYGVTNPSQIKEVMDKIKSSPKKKLPPRTKEHQMKIIDSKRKNGTLKHSQETKDKISSNIKKTVNGETFDKSVYIHEHKNSRNKCGRFNNIYFRSSYEEQFLKFCDKYKIAVESASNNTYCAKYKDHNGENRTYFPDFYLPEFDTVIEIKPNSMLDINNNDLKIHAGMLTLRNFVVLTEDDGFLYEEDWPQFYAMYVKYWNNN